MEKSYCYEAFGSHNETSSYSVGFYDRESTALEAAKGKGFYCDGKVKRISGYTLEIDGAPHFVREADGSERLVGN